MTEGRPSAMAVVNPGARGGRGRALFSSVRERVATYVDIDSVVETTPDSDWKNALASHLSQRHFAVVLAAGGDGTVGAVVDCLMNVPRESRPLLGAIGLGSSNDFHKPAMERVLIPLRVDPTRPSARDVCRVDLDDGESKIVTHFAVSASVGFTAEANACFNDLSGLGAFLKARWTGGAIAFAAVKTLLAHRNLLVSLRHDDEPPQRIELSNLSLLKTPYISGSFRVDFEVLPDNGSMGVALCERLGRFGVVRVLSDLSHGRFVGRAGRQGFHATTLEVETDGLVAVELDGEVYRAWSARFEVIPSAVEVCS